MPIPSNLPGGSLRHRARLAGATLAAGLLSLAITAGCEVVVEHGGYRHDRPVAYTQPPPPPPAQPEPPPPPRAPEPPDTVGGPQAQCAFAPDYMARTLRCVDDCLSADPRVINAARVRLRDMGPHGTDCLIDIAARRDYSANRRAGALLQLEFLGDFGDARAAHACAEDVNDGDPHLRRTAIEICGRCQLRVSVPVLRGVLRTEALVGFHADAAFALSNIDPQDRMELAEILVRSPNPLYRRRGVVLVRETGDHRNLRICDNLARDPDEGVRTELVTTCGVLGDIEAVGILTIELDDPHQAHGAALQLSHVTHVDIGDNPDRWREWHRTEYTAHGREAFGRADAPRHYAGEGRPYEPARPVVVQHPEHPAPVEHPMHPVVVEHPPEHAEHPEHPVVVEHPPEHVEHPDHPEHPVVVEHPPEHVEHPDHPEHPVVVEHPDHQDHPVVEDHHDDHAAPQGRPEHGEPPPPNRNEHAPAPAPAPVHGDTNHGGAHAAPPPAPHEGKPEGKPAPQDDTKNAGHDDHANDKQGNDHGNQPADNQGGGNDPKDNGGHGDHH
ncbi:MAG: hypothetical protein ACREJ2_01950 [Planctomycetota bacterium]